MQIHYVYNVSIRDIEKIERESGITLTDAQRLSIWKRYNRIVTDRAEDWSELIKELIKEYANNKE